MKMKPVQTSKTDKEAIVSPPDANNHGTIFGGKVMAYIDEVGAMAAMKHSRKAVVTASIDSVEFLAPVRVGDAIHVQAFVVSTGQTSMEVAAKVFSEDLLTGNRTLTSTSFVTFVALDEEGRPTEVPDVEPESEEEKYLHRIAVERQQMRAKRKESQNMLHRKLEYWNHS